MDSKNKIFVREKLAGKTTEEAAQIAGITEQELLSAQRSLAGSRGGASKHRIEIQEQNRRKKGRELQQAFDLEKAAVETELKNLNGYIHDDLFDAASSLIEDIFWQRKYPTCQEDMDEEHDSFRNFDGSLRVPKSVEQEEQRFCNYWIDAVARTIIGLSHSVDLAKLPGLKQLVIKALTKFEEWATGQNIPGEDFTQVISRIHQALPRIKDDSIYDPLPPVAMTPEPDIRQHPAYIRDTQAQLAGYTKFGPTPESLAQQSVEAELAAELRMKQEEAQRIIQEEKQRQDLALQQTAPDAWAYLRR